MRFFTRILLVAVVGAVVGCGSDKPADTSAKKDAPEPGVELLTKAMDKYAAMKSFSATAESSISISGETPVSTTHTVDVELPNRYALRFPETKGIAGIKTMPAAYFISDGKSLIEGAGGTAFQTVVAPPQVAAGPDAMILSESWTHNSIFLRLFGGSKTIKLLAGSKPTIDSQTTIDGHKATVIKFTANGMFGTTELSIDNETFLIRRVHCKMEPVLESLAKSMPNIKSIDYVATIKNEKIDAPGDPNRFSTKVDKSVTVTTSVTPSEWLRPGMEAPDFTLTRASGEKVKISSLRGKVVYIDFWATWCGPCKMTLPETQALSEKHKDIEIFAVTDEKNEVAMPFIKANSYTFPVAFDQPREAFSKYGINSIPTFLIIGKDGKIAGLVTGGNIPAVHGALESVGVKL